MPTLPGAGRHRWRALTPGEARVREEGKEPSQTLACGPAPPHAGWGHPGGAHVRHSLPDWATFTAVQPSPAPVQLPPWSWDALWMEHVGCGQVWAWVPGRFLPMHMAGVQSNGVLRWLGVFGTTRAWEDQQRVLKTGSSKPGPFDLEIRCPGKQSSRGAAQEAWRHKSLGPPLASVCTVLPTACPQGRPQWAWGQQGSGPSHPYPGLASPLRGEPRPKCPVAPMNGDASPCCSRVSQSSMLRPLP